VVAKCRDLSPTLSWSSVLVGLQLSHLVGGLKSTSMSSSAALSRLRSSGWYLILLVHTLKYLCSVILKWSSVLFPKVAARLSKFLHVSVRSLLLSWPEGSVCFSSGFPHRLTLQTKPQGSRRFLVEAAFAPATVKKYTEAVKCFLSWCKRRRLDPVDVNEFDECLTDYFHHLYGTGCGRDDAVCTLYGIVMLHPILRDALPISSLALRGWARVVPSQAHPPMTYDLTLLVAVHMARRGLWRYAVGTLLAFDCLLRVGELVGLQRADIADSGDARMGSEYKGMALRLRKTKTGPNQWVDVQDPIVRVLLRDLLRSSRSQGFIFPFSSNEFRDVFKATCAALGLSERYVPHSLRHGGATRLHLMGVSIEDILLRGRWASSKSARRYIQSGRALLLSMRVPARLQEVASRIAASPILSLVISKTLSQLHK
jgi:hypothetical protein